MYSVQLGQLYVSMRFRQFCDFVSLVISPPFGVIAEASWERQVRNNFLALHSYFEQRDGAMNNDMDLAVPESFVVLP